MNDSNIKKIDGLKVIVFDLDYTLWPFWVDTHVTPPFHKRNDKVYDAHQQIVRHYPEVPEILKQLKQCDYMIAVASRTGCIDEAEQLLRLFDWNKFIDCKQIYPGCKITHITRICKQLSCNFDELIFFDDEHRNIRDLQREKNVCSILVRNGMTFKVLNDGFDEFLRNRK